VGGRKPIKVSCKGHASGEASLFGGRSNSRAPPPREVSSLKKGERSWRKSGLRAPDREELIPRERSGSEGLRGKIEQP